MTIRHMKVFVEVYQTKSISRAAENLYISQPVVTRTIKELEKYYGVLLFERISQRLSITEAGKQLYAYAIHIIDSFDQMETSLRNWDEIGVIRIGASVTMGSTLLPKALKEFKHSHKGIKVKTSVLGDSTLQRMLENNELDIAIIEGTTFNENLIADEFGSDEVVLLIPSSDSLVKEGKIKIEDLNGKPFLLREKGNVSREMVERIFADNDMNLNIFMESISEHAIVQGVHEGLGFSFLPLNLVRHSIDSGYIASKPIAGEELSRKNYIVYHKNKLLTKAVKDFIALCHSLGKELNFQESI